MQQPLWYVMNVMIVSLLLIMCHLVLFRVLCKSDVKLFCWHSYERLSSSWIKIKFGIAWLKCLNNFEIFWHYLADKTKRRVTPWTSEEKSVIFTFFGQHIKETRVPRQGDCQRCLESSDVFHLSRDWRSIKNCVHNLIQKTKKQGLIRAWFC